MRKSAVTVTLLAALLGAGCGAGDGGGAGRRSEAASGLAVRADGVAAALNAGQCDAALAEARTLQADLVAADLEPAVRAEALAGAIRVVNGIVCAPTTTTTTTTTTTVAATPAARSGDDDKKGKGRKGDDDDD
jgi:hypothetical protein